MSGEGESKFWVSFNRGWLYFLHALAIGLAAVLAVMQGILALHKSKA